MTDKPRLISNSPTDYDGVTSRRPKDPLSKLAAELHTRIASYSDVQTAISLSTVCRSLQRPAESRIWQHLVVLGSSSGTLGGRRLPKAMCLEAIVAAIERDAWRRNAITSMDIAMSSDSAAAVKTLLDLTQSRLHSFVIRESRYAHAGSEYEWANGQFSYDLHQLAEIVCPMECLKRLSVLLTAKADYEECDHAILLFLHRTPNIIELSIHESIDDNFDGRFFETTPLPKAPALVYLRRLTLLIKGGLHERHSTGVSRILESIADKVPLLEDVRCNHRGLLAFHPIGQKSSVKRVDCVGVGLNVIEDWRSLEGFHGLRSLVIREVMAFDDEYKEELVVCSTFRSPY